MTNIVDLGRVRRALSELDRAAREWPELVGSELPSELEASFWEDELSSIDCSSSLIDSYHDRTIEDMAETQLRQFRLEDKLVARLDRYAQFLRRSHPAFDVTRSTALRALLMEGLDRFELAHPDVAAKPLEEASETTEPEPTKPKRTRKPKGPKGEKGPTMLEDRFAK